MTFDVQSGETAGKVGRHIIRLGRFPRFGQLQLAKSFEQLFDKDAHLTTCQRVAKA